jgi:hypothetical protein
MLPDTIVCLSLFLVLRIRTELEGGAWCPDKPIGTKSTEFIQIELHQLFFINAIETQGRFDNGQGNEYAEYYRIQYQRETNSSHWLTYYNKKTNQTVRRTSSSTRVRSAFGLGQCSSRVDRQRQHQHVLGRETRPSLCHSGETHSNLAVQFEMANSVHACRALWMSILRFVSSRVRRSTVVRVFV